MPHSFPYRRSSNLVGFAAARRSGSTARRCRRTSGCVRGSAVRASGRSPRAGRAVQPEGGAVRRDTGPGLTGPTGSDAPSLAVVDDPTEMDQPVAATEATASALVAACEEAWAAIQQHHPDLPAVVIVLGSGVERGRLVKRSEEHTSEIQSLI